MELPLGPICLYLTGLGLLELGIIEIITPRRRSGLVGGALTRALYSLIVLQIFSGRS